MAKARSTLLNENDLYDMPDDGQHYELSRGHLVSEPPTGIEHGRVAAQIAIALGNFVNSRSLGVVLSGDPGFVLARNPDTLRAPDVAFLTTKRYLSLRDTSRFMPGAPDLAVEVLSPGERKGRINAKLTDYRAAGTRLVWIVDPKVETVCVYRQNETAWVYPPESGHALLRGANELTGADVLPGFRVQVGDLFRI